MLDWVHHRAGERLALVTRRPEPALECWVLRVPGSRKRAHVSIERGRVAFNVGRFGEINAWHEAADVNDAKLLAEIMLEDMPEIGPLEECCLLRTLERP